MALAPSPATSPSDLAAASLRLPWDLRLTPEQFERVCQDNPDAVLELAADGTLIAMTPTGGETGSRNGELLYQLQALCRRHRAWRMFDSSTGFRLPDGSVLSPDGSLLRMALYQANGARLGWLLLPEQRAVDIWRGGDQGMAERLEDASRLDGGELAEGLGLDLEEIWAV